MLYVIYPDVEIWQYMLQDYKEDRDGIRIRALNQNCKKWQLAMRKIFNNSRLPSVFLFNQRLRKELSALKEGDSVLLCDYADPIIVKAINSLVSPVVKKHFWIWNPVTDKDRTFYSHAFKVMNINGFTLATFDEHDAKQYGMHLYNQFFRKDNNVNEKGDEPYDFYFIGYAKNREQDLLRLKEQLKNFRVLFKIVHRGDEAISYEESVKNIMHSKCIVEYVQHNQSGMTLRPLEALFYNKKLITNNSNTINYDFYCPENVFILGKDKFEDLNVFLETPCRITTRELVEKYCVKSWFNHFIEL